MKKLISLLFAILMIASSVTAVSAANSGFSDVEDDRWSAAAISYAVKEGYMNGVGGGLFDPEGSLTRAMVATVLWRREGSPAPTVPNDFTDVPDGEWYTDAVTWAKNVGVVKGITENTFEPDSFITREQLATMLFRFSSSAPVSVPERADLSPFADDEKTSDWAEEPLEWAVEAGLINGTDGNRLDPGGCATREQFAAIIKRYDETFNLIYVDPVPLSRYTEKEYPLVEDADVYVSPDGDDGAAGDIGHPVATFARAIEMVRALKETVTDRSIVVAFKAGVYETENVTMTAEDSGTKEYPVIYCGYGDGEAIITGGVSVSADKFEPVDGDKREWFEAKAVDKIKKVYIGDILPGYTSKDVIFSENGVLCLARFPDKYPDGTDNLYKYAGETVSDHEIRIKNVIMQRRVSQYHTLEGLKLYGYLTTGWFKDTLDVGGLTIDEETGGYDFYIPNPETARMGSLRYGEFPWSVCHESCFMNMTEDLNAEGEYWVDEDTLTLYVYDPHGSYTFPVKDYGIIMDRCDYVTFRGLTVMGYRENLLKASASVGLTLDRCKFSTCTSTMAMTVGGRAGVDFDTKITNCEFSVFAGRVISVGGPCGVRQMFTERGNFLFDNNLVTLTNLVMEWNSAVSVGGCNEAVLSHNEFVDCSYMAITYGGSNLLIEYNVFKNCMFNSHDCGAIYCGNSQSDWNNVIRYNLFYPLVGDRYAIYLDDDEPGAEIYGNMFVESAVTIHDGRSNNVHDNVVLRSGGVNLSGGGVMEALEQYLETGDLEAFLKHDRAGAFYPRWVSFFETLDSDPVLKEKYFEMSPELATLTVDLERAGEEGFVIAPRNYVRDNVYFKKDMADVNKADKYSVVEGNRCFTTDENPIFVNPTKGDYRIREGADFPDFHFELIGRY